MAKKKVKTNWSKPQNVPTIELTEIMSPAEIRSFLRATKELKAANAEVRRLRRLGRLA